MSTDAVISIELQEKYGINPISKLGKLVTNLARRIMQYLSSRREAIGIALVTSIVLDLVTGLIFGIAGGALIFSILA